MIPWRRGSRTDPVGTGEDRWMPRARCRPEVVLGQIGSIIRSRIARHGAALVVGVGIETADMLVRDVLSPRTRDQKAVARYARLSRVDSAESGRPDTRVRFARDSPSSGSARQACVE